MCQSRAQGGKRCYGAALTSFQSATAAHVTAEASATDAINQAAVARNPDGLDKALGKAAKARQKMTETGIELGSSEHGRAELNRQARIASSAGDHMTAARLTGYVAAGREYERLRAERAKPAAAGTAGGRSRGHQRAVEAVRAGLFAAPAGAILATQPMNRQTVTATAVAGAVASVVAWRHRQENADRRDMDTATATAETTQIVNWRDRAAAAEEGWTSIPSVSRG